MSKLTFSNHDRGSLHQMQNRSFVTRSITSPAKSPATKPSMQPPVTQDQLVRIFNTSLVSTRAKKKRDFSSELCKISESPSFKAILNAVQQFSRIHGITERQATEEVIQTFRKLDEIWGEYVFHEGLDKLRGPKK